MPRSPSPDGAPSHPPAKGGPPPDEAAPLVGDHHGVGAAAGAAHHAVTLQSLHLVGARACMCACMRVNKCATGMQMCVCKCTWCACLPARLMAGCFSCLLGPLLPVCLPACCLVSETTVPPFEAAAWKCLCGRPGLAGRTRHGPTHTPLQAGRQADGRPGGRAGRADRQSRLGQQEWQAGTQAGS